MSPRKDRPDSLPLNSRSSSTSLRAPSGSGHWSAPATSPPPDHRYSHCNGIHCQPGTWKWGSIGNQKLGVCTQNALPTRRILRRHAPLVLKCKQMLDHGVAECDIKTAICELGQVGGVSRNRLDIFVPRLFGNKIQTEYLNIGPPSPPPVLPEIVLATTSRIRRGRGMDAVNISNSRNRRARSLFENDVGSSSSASHRKFGIENSIPKELLLNWIPHLIGVNSRIVAVYA